MTETTTEQAPIATPRGFFALHRDTWSTALKAPDVFIALPVVAWLAVDLVIEALAAGMMRDSQEGLRFLSSLQRLAQWIVGSLIVAVQLSAAAALAQQRELRLDQAFKAGLGHWSRLCGVYFGASWRIALGLLAFVVPGVFLAVRYALAMPVAVFEARSGRDALEASGRYVRGSGWKILGFGVAACALYAPVMFAPLALVPDDAPSYLLALASIPVNLFASLTTVALALMYADRAPGWPAVGPIGQARLDEPHAATPSRGTAGVLGAGALSLLLTGSGVAFVVLAPAWAIYKAETAYASGQYDEALAGFERASSWLPDDPYVEYSLAWCWIMIDDLDLAEIHMARAVALEPRNAGYLLDHAALLYDLERLDEAGDVLDRVRELGHPDQARVRELHQWIAAGFQSNRT